MEFNYSRHGIGKTELFKERIFEILPGFLSWIIIIGVCFFSIVKPLACSVFMIAFLLYWFLRLIYMNIFLILSYFRLEIEKNTDWMKRLEAIDNLKSKQPYFCGSKGIKGFKDKISAGMHCSQLKKIISSEKNVPFSKDIYHLVIIPVVREDRGVVEPGIMAIKNGDYPSKRFLVIIALEESASAVSKEDMYAIKEKYKDDFLDFLVIVHPANRPNEAKVKGANATFSAKAAQEYFNNKNIPLENVLVSCFDSDSVANPKYFSCLTYYFLINPNRLNTSYQPIPVYHNNIWDAPGFARIIDIGTSFFQLIESTNPGKLVTFSSHSMSFKALADIGFWPVDMISDDSAIFWKAFIHYQGNYAVEPIYTTVSMDIAVGATIPKTIVSIYKQKRRWAWGIENFPIVMRAFLRLKNISLRRKVSYMYKLLDSFISWATWSFLLLFGTWLPVFFATREFATSTVYYTAPRIQQIMFSLASVGLVICMVISLMLLPKKKTKYGFFVKLGHVFEWLLIPVVLVFLSALPALDAQTRLMFGRYMEFWVTDKYRSRDD